MFSISRWSTSASAAAGARSAGRVLGATEFVCQAGLGAGAVAAPLLLRALGVRGTLGLLGGGLTVLALAHVRRFVRLDRAMPPPGEEVGLLRRLAMFAPLPLAVIELLATDLKPHEFAPGTAAVREGEAGDLFYLIVAGSATVNVGGKPGPCEPELAAPHVGWRPAGSRISISKSTSVSIIMLADFADYQRRPHRASLKAADIAAPPTAAARPAEDLFSDQAE